MNWNREVSKNLEHTKIGITDWRNTAERRHVLKQARRWARWQRDQLRSNEAIERVAYAYQANVKRHREERLPDLPKETQNYYRQVAKSMIAAQMGDDWWIEK